MSAIDYVGRTADLLVFHSTDENVNLPVTQAIVPAGRYSGYLTTGIQKLTQKFLLALLTIRGSKQYKPLDGCQFMADVRRGRWRTVADVRQSFYSALVDVKRQLQLDENAETPEDEQYAEASLDDVKLTWPDASLTITLVSAAGTSRTFVAPLGVVVQS